MKPEDKEHNEEKDHEAHKSKTEELQKRLDDLQTEKDNLFAQLQRVSADYANFEKRSARQIADSVTYEKERIIKSLLPALDNFEHALQNIRSAEIPHALVKGVQMVYDHMIDILTSHNVQQIKALDEKFDPSLHRAILTQSVPEQQDGIVLAEHRKGYTLNGRTIRPSEVIVNKIAAIDSTQPQDQAAADEVTDTE